MLTTKALQAGALGLACSLSYMLPILMVSPATAAVLAKVNGKAITDEDLRLAMEDLGPSLPQQLEGKARETYLLDYLIDGSLVAQKAPADTADQDPEFAKKLAYYREKILMESVLGKIAKDATTDEAMKKVYDEAAA